MVVRICLFVVVVLFDFSLLCYCDVSALFVVGYYVTLFDLFALELCLLEFCWCGYVVHLLFALCLLGFDLGLLNVINSVAIFLCVIDVVLWFDLLSICFSLGVLFVCGLLCLGLMVYLQWFCYSVLFCLLDLVFWFVMGWCCVCYFGCVGVWLCWFFLWVFWFGYFGVISFNSVVI